MEKSTLTEDKAEKTPTGGVLVGKREGQTIIHNKGTLSGYLVGKTHAEGGIKAVNKSTGQPLEMQGGEVVITAPAVSDNTKREFEGKMMTNREILSAINVKGGGVAFASGGDIPKKIKRTGASYKYGGKTMTDHEIYKYITGGGIAEDLSIRDIANIHQVPLAELKEEVRIGMIAESEHKADKKDQMEIVKDHLLENPKYYTLLKKAGLVEEDTAPLEKSKWLKQFYVTNNPSIDKLLKDLQPKINELIEKQKELAIKESTRIFGEPRPMSELDIQFYEAGLIFKMVQAFNKYLKNTDELYDVSIDKRGSLFEVNGKVKRDGRSYKFVTELIDAGGYNIQEYHYRYIIKTDLPSSNENSAVENIKAKMGVLKKIRTIDEDIARYSKYISESEKELMQGFREFKIQGLEHKRDLSDFDVEHNKKRIQDFNKEIQKLEGKKADLISVFESLDKKGVGANFGKQVKEAIGRRILVDRLQGSKYKETGDTLDFKIETRFNKNAKINTFSFLDEGNGLCTMKAGLELRGKYTPYAEYKNLPIKEIPYKINEIFNGDFSKYLEFKDGGVMEKENLVKDAKSGNTPARDLNNYNDVLDIDADGMVGAETGLYADGGDVKPYDANMEGDSADMMFAEGGAVSSVVDNWDEVPSIWKNTSKVKKVAWTNSPYDKGLYSIIAPFLGNDDLRPIMTGINFDENGITVTNAHILITLPYPNKQFEGTYESDLSKRVSSEQITIDGKYPNYVPIIPESKNTVKYEVDVYKLLQYTNVAIKYANKTTYAVNYKIYDEIIGFNAKYLNQVLTTLLKLGHNKVYGHFVGYTKAFVFSSEKNYELGNDDILLIMPLVTEKKFYGAEDMLYGSNRKLSVYYDFNDNELHNADGSIAEFKMTYENNSVISKEDVTLLEKLANGKNRVPILDYVLVENGVARATDLYSEYYLSGVALPDGIYKPNKGALEITMEAIEDFPTSPIFVTDEDTLQFVISSDIFEYYIDKLKYVVGTDDLREILKGICLHHTSDNKLFLVATDTHILLKVNITEYVDMPEVYKDMKFIIEPKRLYDFLNSTENTALTIKSNLVATSIQSDNWSFYARNIDGNYPNYEAVMPRETNKLAMVNLEPIKKAFNTEMVKNYVKEANQKDKVFIFNKENEIFIATYTSGDNIEKICETNVDFRLDDYFNENQSVLLFMPFGFDKQTNFAFRKDLLERVFKIVNDNKLELHYNELNRAYVIPIDTIEYKTTTKEHKVKEQKPSAEEIKLVSTINEINEIKEVIESLEILLENANRKDKKEIKETIEGLQILLDTYEY